MVWLYSLPCAQQLPWGARFLYPIAIFFLGYLLIWVAGEIPQRIIFQVPDLEGTGLVVQGDVVSA